MTSPLALTRRIRFTADGREIIGDGDRDESGERDEPDLPAATPPGATLPPIDAPSPISLQPHTAPGERPDGFYPVVLRGGPAPVTLYPPRPPPMPKRPLVPPPKVGPVDVGVGTRPSPEPVAPIDRLSRPAGHPPCRLKITGQGRAVRGPMAFIGACAWVYLF
jgi:hypothetical protein